MASDWIPAKDQDLAAFALNMDTLVTAGPATYGLDTASATALHTARSTFTASLAAATNPVTKTALTVAQKDADKASLKTLMRELGAIVQATPSVSNANRIALGLKVKSTTPTPIPEPTTTPQITATPSGSLLHTLKYADSATPSSKRKPSGSIAMLLFCSPSATPITDPTALKFNQLVTTNPQQIEFQSADAGHVAYYAARWVTRTGLMGPWSSIVATGIAA